MGTLFTLTLLIQCSTRIIAFCYSNVVTDLAYSIIMDTIEIIGIMLMGLVLVGIAADRLFKDKPNP